MAVKYISSSKDPKDCICYVVSGKEAKILEHYLWGRSEKEVQEEHEKELKLLKKSEKRRKMWKEKGFLN